MAHDRTEGMHPRHAAVPRRPVGPLSFDIRQNTLARALREHVLVRDACLAPPSLISGKLAAIDDPPTTMYADLDALVERVSVVQRLSRVRATLRDVAPTLPIERRQLVLLDVLCATFPADDTPWSRPLEDLLDEAADHAGCRGEARRLTRALRSAGRSLPNLPPAAREPATGPVPALAEALRLVGHHGRGAALAVGIHLLSGATHTGTTPSRCGGVLVDPALDEPRHLGTFIAELDPAAFWSDLTVLVAAASISPTVRRYAHVHLLALAEELRERDLLDAAHATVLASRVIERRPRRALIRRRY